MDASDQQTERNKNQLTELVLPANLMDCFETYRRGEVRKAVLPFNENELSWFLHMMNELRGADDYKDDFDLLFDPMMYTVDHPAWSAPTGLTIELPMLNSVLGESTQVGSEFRRIAEAEIAGLRTLAGIYPDEAITGLARIATAALADTEACIADRKSAIRYLALNASARLEDYWAADDSLWQKAGNRTVTLPDVVAEVKDLMLKRGSGEGGILKEDLVCYSEDEVKLFAFGANRFLLSGKTKHLAICGRCQERIQKWIELVRNAEDCAMADGSGSASQA